MASQLPPLSFKLNLLKFAGKLLLGVGLLLVFFGRESLPLFMLPAELANLLRAWLLIPLGLGLLLPVWRARLRAMAQQVQSNKVEGTAQLHKAAAAAGASAPDPQKVAALLRQMQKAAGSKGVQPAPARAQPSASRPPIVARPETPLSSAPQHIGESAVRRRHASSALIRR